MSNQYAQKSIVEQMSECGLSDFEIFNIMDYNCKTSIFKEDKTTTRCTDCKYFKEIYGVKTCKKNAKILDINVCGCYGGEKW